MKYVPFGKTGLTVSELGFGSLPMSFGQLNLPEEQCVSLLLYALEKGFTLFDTAQFYQTYRVIRKATQIWNELHPSLPSDRRPVIVSKSLAGDYEGMMHAILECRQALGVNAVDVFLLHEVFGLEDLQARHGAKDALLDAKKAGYIRFTGVSTHHSDVAETVAQTGDFDVLFPLINVASMGIRRGDGFGTKEEMERAIATADRNGMAVMGMKAFGGGPLLPRYRECLDYWYSLPGMHTKILGFGSEEEIDRALEYAAGRLRDDYAPDMNRKELFIEDTDCIGCGACIARCPNKALRINPSTGQAQVDRSLCMTCGYCTPVCPMRAIILLSKRP